MRHSKVIITIINMISIAIIMVRVVVAAREHNVLAHQGSTHCILLHHEMTVVKVGIATVVRVHALARSLFDRLLRVVRLMMMRPPYECLDLCVRLLPFLAGPV
jgi:hypothetical protein